LGEAVRGHSWKDGVSEGGSDLRRSAGLWRITEISNSGKSEGGLSERGRGEKHSLRRSGSEANRSTREE